MEGPDVKNAKALANMHMAFAEKCLRFGRASLFADFGTLFFASSLFIPSNALLLLHFGCCLLSPRVAIRLVVR